MSATPVDPASGVVYPVGLRLLDRKVVVVGGGQVAHRRVAGLLEARARVTVVSPEVTPALEALVAAAFAPAAVDYCVAGHRSAEPGHSLTLTHLGLEPLLDLGMRLGEGTGALLALPLVASAARALRDVATFDSAGVTSGLTTVTRARASSSPATRRCATCPPPTTTTVRSSSRSPTG